jgi:hypothetical protein
MAKNGTSRVEAATGFVFVALFVIAFGGFIAPGIPKASATAPEWQSYFVDHQDRIQAGVAILCVATLAFLWFLGSVRARLGTAEGGDRRLTSIAYAGGIGLVVFSFLAITATAVAAYRPGDTNAEVTQAFNDFGLLAGAPGAAATAAFFGATAIIGYRHRPFVAPIAGFCALAAVTAPLTIPIVATDSGAFAPDGLLGLDIPVATFIIGALALSIGIFRPPPPPRVDRRSGRRQAKPLPPA